jgi:uncharacterized membrane protein (DUF106 family)
MELIPQAKQAWRFTSVQAAAVIAILGVFQANSDKFKELISPTGFGWLMLILGLLVGIFRVIQQSIPVTAETKQDMVINAFNNPVKGETPKDFDETTI